MENMEDFCVSHNYTQRYLLLLLILLHLILLPALLPPPIWKIQKKILK
jgi:hypothetical protein